MEKEDFRFICFSGSYFSYSSLKSISHKSLKVVPYVYVRRRMSQMLDPSLVLSVTNCPFIKVLIYMYLHKKFYVQEYVYILIYD